MTRFTPILATAAMLAGLSATAPAAQELKFSHMFPETHYMWDRGGRVLAERVAEATNGEVTFNNFPSGQLGKDYIGQLGSGLADIAIVVPATMSDKLPLTSVSELPVPYESSCEASSKLWALSKEGGPLFDAEFAPRGLRPIFTVVLPNYRLMTSKKQITSLDDVVGLKIRASGAAMEATARALGAVAVTISAAEITDSLRRGTVDGALYPTQAVIPYGLENVLRYGLEGPTFGSSSSIMIMPEAKWQKISEENRQKILDIAHEIQGDFCQWMDDEDTRMHEVLIDEYGYQPHVLDTDEIAQWQERLQTVADEWAARMDSQNLPGSAILQAFMEAQPEDQ